MNLKDSPCFGWTFLKFFPPNKSKLNRWSIPESFTNYKKKLFPRKTWPDFRYGFSQIPRRSSPEIMEKLPPKTAEKKTSASRTVSFLSVITWLPIDLNMNPFWRTESKHGPSFTPLKSSMAPQNEGLEDDIPFQAGDFQVPY